MPLSREPPGIFPTRTLFNPNPRLRIFPKPVPDRLPPLRLLIRNSFHEYQILLPGKTFQSPQKSPFPPQKNNCYWELDAPSNIPKHFPTTKDRPKTLSPPNHIFQNSTEYPNTTFTQSFLTKDSLSSLQICPRNLYTMKPHPNIFHPLFVNPKTF